MTGRVSRRALNRATLARQLLLDRSGATPIEAVTHLVGLQAQAPWAPYHQLAARLDGFAPDDLGTLLLERRVVRMAVMRGTIHLMTVADAAALRPLVQPVLDRGLTSNKERRDALQGADLDAIAAAGAALLDGEVLGPGELGDRLAEAFPGILPSALATVVRDRVPIVQTPPRGVWGRTGAPTVTRFDSWVAGGSPPVRGDDLPPPMALDEVVRRYLAAFGPASVKDVQTWSGLTRLAPVVAAMADELVRLEDDDGVVLHDLPDAPRPGPDVDAPVRLLGEFDNLILSHADRRRVVPEQHRTRLATRNGMQPATVLVDGTVAGTWRLGRSTRSASVEVDLWAPRSSKATLSAIEREGARLLDLLAPEATGRDVRIMVA
jgi:hypothetical protein